LWSSIVYQGAHLAAWFAGGTRVRLASRQPVKAATNQRVFSAGTCEIWVMTPCAELGVVKSVYWK
jgi:hypothetical protein